MCPDYHITDAQVLKLRTADVVHAVDQAFRALALGAVVNPPRRETLGREGQPDYFRIELSARDTGERAWQCTKVIEEEPSYDASGARQPGRRVARVDLWDPELELTVTADAEALTNLRTGVSALLSAAYLVPDASISLAVIGTGRVAREVVAAAESVLSIGEIRVMSRNRENVDRLIDDVSGDVKCPVLGFTDARRCAADADVVIAAVPSSEPLFSAGDVASASHLTAVGGDPRVVLFGRDIWTSRATVADLHAQAFESGDLRAASKAGWQNEITWAASPIELATVGAAAVGEFAHLREVPTVAILTGLAALDLAVARLAWRKDKRRAELVSRAFGS